MGIRKPYIALVDQRSPYRKGSHWFSGRIKCLTDEKAKPLLEKGKIRETTIEPKRFVTIIFDDGTEDKINWSEYLKRIKKGR